MVWDKSIKSILQEFPADRLTFQKGIATFHPESADDAARLFALANKIDQKLFITGFGNNIDPEGEKFRKLITIRTDRLNAILKIAPEDFYIVVGSGYPLSEINRVLYEHGLFMPHAGLPYAGSVGGALAAGLAANQGEHGLPIGRYFIMAEIVLPTGEIIKPGSVCFKSVSGFDIVKIFSPSWGLLGLIVSATLRVLPLSVREEYDNLKMKPIDYRAFCRLYNNPGADIAAQYSLKIKHKFDPKNILPLVE
jgi:FAD/FMN-containing dehydrogenase